MRRLFTPVKLLILGIVLVAVFLALLVLPSNDYVFLPDRAHPVGPLVSFPGARESKSGARGGVYFVDVIVRKATLLERLFGGLHAGADLYPANAVNPPGVGSSQRIRIDVEDMQRSQKIAAAVALRAAGKKVVIREDGALVDQLQPGDPSVGKLEPDDVITAVNGTRVGSPAAVEAVMKKQKIGSVVRFTIRREKQTLVVPIKTVLSTGPRRAVIGVYLEPAVDIHLPFPVRIDVGNVGGPSAGLAFALEVLVKLGHDVVHGHKIAATGELFPNGAVGPIGGVKQKTIGAREAGVDAFLVPAGENAQEARKYAHGLRIIPVESFHQALRALATLGPKS